MTHAFFKALLFLGSGSVIHAMNDEQEMTKMGGLRQYMPVTFKTMFIGSMAIAGVPLLSGFFSKDEILYYAFLQSPALWGARDRDGRDDGVLYVPVDLHDVLR